MDPFWSTAVYGRMDVTLLALQSEMSPVIQMAKRYLVGLQIFSCCGFTICSRVLSHTYTASTAAYTGALFGISFAGSVLPQITASIEAFAGARSAAYPALEAIYRDVHPGGDEGEVSVMEEKSLALQRRGLSTPLPTYAIDSSSPMGLRPKTVAGNLRFENVSFSYPSRAESLVFDGFNLDVPEGKTVALVGTR
jgi:ABC-type multidrug transport system fused ATPase/permease subunit